MATSIDLAPTPKHTLLMNIMGKSPSQYRGDVYRSIANVTVVMWPCYNENDNNEG